MPGDDATGDGDVVAAGGVAHARHRLLEMRHVAESEGHVALPKGVVVHSEEGQVALVAYAHHSGDVALRVAVSSHPASMEDVKRRREEERGSGKNVHDGCGFLYDVGVGEDPAWVNGEA